MINLNYNEIRKLGNDQVFREGFRFYQQDKISPIVQKNEVLEARVHDTEDYEISIEFSPATGFVFDYNCTCSAYTVYNEPCAHIIGVLLKILYTKDQISLTHENSTTESLIKSFENILTAHPTSVDSDKKTLNMEVVLEPISLQQVKLSLKIGLEKLYVVKDIEKQISAYINYKPLQHSGTFTYDPDIHTFSEKDNNILNIIADFYSSYQHTVLFSQTKKIFFQNTVELPDYLLVKVLRLLSDSTFSIRKNGLSKSDQTMLHALDLNFDIKEKANDVIITMDDYNSLVFLTKNREFLMYSNNIYHLNQKERTYIKAIEKYFKNKKIVVNQLYKDRVFSGIYPVLSKSGSVETADSLTNNLYQTNCLADIYLDKLGDSVKGTLTYQYGEYAYGIYPPKKPVITDSSIVVKDLAYENNIYQLLKKAKIFIPENLEYFTFNDEDDLFDFIHIYLPQLNSIANVYYSEDFKKVHINIKHTLHTAIRLNSHTNMLDFSFKFDHVDRSELKDLLKSFSTKKKFYKFKDGSFLHLDSPEIADFMGLVNNLQLSNSDLLQESIEIPKYRAIALNNYLREETVIDFKRNRLFTKLVNDIKKAHNIKHEIPALKDVTLRDYQKIGYRWLRTLSDYGFGGILADDMGLGKTLQSIALIKSLSSDLPSLVVAPTSLVYNWEDEILRFAPDLKMCLLVGSKNNRTELFHNLNDYDIIITSYGLLKRDIDDYLAYQFQFCIIDEAQHIKNPTSLNAKSVKLIKARNRFALTGTPIENSLTELWSIFDFIMPGFLYTHHQFSKLFEAPIIKKNEISTINKLNALIEPFILRRLKLDVLSELPPKIETKMTTELSDEQKKLYLAYLDEAKSQLKNNTYGNKSKSNAIQMLSILTRLRQICCHPALFINEYKGSSSKLDLLEELVLDATESGHRILIFSQFTSMLSLIKDVLTANGLSFLYLDGATKSMDRIELVNEFNNSDIEIFLISLKAGGTGLNLTGADMVIHFDPWWNPATEEQATDRAYRIGQDKPVQVFKLITTGTIEEKIFHLQESKRSLIESVIKPGDTFINRLSEDELLKILEL